MYSNQRGVKTVILLPKKATKSRVLKRLTLSHLLSEMKTTQRSSTSCDS